MSGYNLKNIFTEVYIDNILKRLKIIIDKNQINNTEDLQTKKVNLTSSEKPDLHKILLNYQKQISHAINIGDIFSE
ncbi:MAG TPA: hypothetical protein VJ697_12615 [Nitrososphaeraceae archaeon]|nr:hypothetical protein [Nitrososphaeraceae archaeon]